MLSLKVKAQLLDLIVGCLFKCCVCCRSSLNYEPLSTAYPPQFVLLFVLCLLFNAGWMALLLTLDSFRTTCIFLLLFIFLTWFLTSLEMDNRVHIVCRMDFNFLERIYFCSLECNHDRFRNSTMIFNFNKFILYSKYYSSSLKYLTL